MLKAVHASLANILYTRHLSQILVLQVMHNFIEVATPTNMQTVKVIRFNEAMLYIISKTRA